MENRKKRQQKFEKTAILDLVVIAVICGVACSLALTIGVFEWIHQASGAHEDWPVDEIAIVLTVLVISLSVFSLRRWKELRRENAARKQAEEALQKELEKSKQHQKEITALLDGARAILKHRDFVSAARSLFDSCKNLIGARAGYIGLLSSDGSRNEILFLDCGGLPCTVDPSLPMPVRGLREKACSSGRAVFENDFPSSEWAARYIPEGHPPLSNVLFAPLVAEDRTVGLLGLADKDGGFTRHDAEMATAFGELMSVALLNSRTFELLQHSEEQFRSLARSATDGIIIIDSKGTITFWNMTAAKLFGYPAGEAVGRPLTMIMPERFHDAHKKGMERYLTTGRPVVIGKTVEIAGLGKDGNEIPLELTVSTFETGEERYFTGIMRDITERKRVEQALKKSEARLKAQYKGIPLPTYTWRRTDDDFVLTDYNDAAEETTSGGAAKLVGKKASELYHDSPEIIDDINRCFSEKLVVRREMQYQLRSTGENRHLFVSYAFVPPDLVMVHTEDITARKMAEERVKDQSAELKARNRELATLYEVTSTISGTIDMEKLMDLVLGTVTGLELLNVERKGAILIVEDNKLRLVSHLNLSQSFIDAHGDKGIEIGECLCGLAAESGEVIVSKNCFTDSNHTIRYAGMNPHGHIVVPLKMANRVLGVLALYLPAGFEADERQLKLMKTIGNQLGIAIENSRLYEQTRKLSLHDPLTGLANRNYMNIELEKCLARTRRTGRPFSLIMLDLDHFKKYNDTYGHAAGDKMLADIAAAVLDEIREVDLAVRYGGEEFLIILADSERDQAFEVADRIRKRIMDTDYFFSPEQPPTRMTVSEGVAACEPAISGTDELIIRADNALYDAKRKGRNRVEVW